MRASLLIFGLSALSAATVASASVEVRFEGGGSLVADKVEVHGELAVLTLPGGGQLAVENRRVQAMRPLPAPAPVALPPVVPQEDTVAPQPPPAESAAIPEPVPQHSFTQGEEHGGFGHLIEAAALKHGLDPELLRCVLLVESGFDPAAVSPKGAMGLAQLMPGTARDLGVADPFDPAQAVDGSALLLARLLDESQGRLVPALAAYNAGQGAVRRYGGLPPYGETIRYIEKVLTLYHAP